VRQIQPSARRPSGVSMRRGMTIIEILVVMVVLSIVAGLALPRIDFSGLRADAGARLLRTTMTQAGRLAVLRQHDIIVSFDVAKSTMIVIEDTNNSGALDAGERSTTKPFEEGVGFVIPAKGISGSTPTAPVIGTSVKTINSLPSVIFRRNGAASSDIEIYLSTQSNKPTDARAVAVTKSTGRVDWFRNTATGWRPGGV
jgi:prepilin-type N-terminal cleavage/methylation domain-containing protein